MSTANPNVRLVARLPFEGYWSSNVELWGHYNYEEDGGYPYGCYEIRNLSVANLRALADAMISLPPALYESVEDAHRTLERILAREGKV